MLKTVEYSELLSENKDHILIDVRTSKEYEEATIPGAVNIPLFTDEDREKIGYVYVNESIEKAKRMGIEAVSARLPFIYDEVLKNYKKRGKLVFFCARGGMRSSSISSLLNSLGINSYKIRGGYKAYRDYINESLPKLQEHVTYIVIHGKTGVGKTQILKGLKKSGYDVIDLECAANHRGSLLGSVGLGKQRSQKLFESLIHEELSHRKSNYVFIEGESQRIGNIIIPNFMFNKMREGIHLYLDADIDFRARLLIEEYTANDNAKEQILDCLELMKKHISDENIKRYKNLVEEEAFKEVCKELMVKYYDPMYQNSMKKYKYEKSFNIHDIKEGCFFIEQWFEDFKASLKDCKGNLED